MAYAIAAVVVVLLVGGFVMFMVLNATSKSGPNPEGRDEAPGIGADDTPLGDTTQHAGEQNSEGETTDDPEQDDFERVDPDEAADEAAHLARPGEAEGEERIHFDGVHPERDRDA